MKDWQIEESDESKIVLKRKSISKLINYFHWINEIIKKLIDFLNNTYHLNNIKPSK